MKKVVVTANAKINLGLFIKGRRPDGFHLLETLYYPLLGTDFPHDVISIEEIAADGIQLEMTGMDEEIPLEKNLAWKAWKLFADAFPEMPGVKIHVTKKIPSGAGLGGGSSDAAHTLTALNELMDFPFSKPQLALMAKILGSDVPFFIYNQPMLGKGTGTELEPFDLDLKYRIQLFLPGIHSSTPEAYKGLELDKIDTHRSLVNVLKLPVEEWKEKLVNDLEAPVFKRFPVLAEMKQKMYDDGAVYAAMSGSGSAVFGLWER